MSAAPIRDEELREIAAECLAMRARLVARAVTSLSEEALRPHGLKLPQVNLLVATGAMEPVRPAELGAVLHLDPSTLSRTLERLCAQRLLERAPDPDGRAAPVRLTTQGRRALAKLLPDWRATQERIRELLGAEGAEALLAMGRRLQARR